jgi:hypothetical protein
VPGRPSEPTGGTTTRLSAVEVSTALRISEAALQNHISSSGVDPRLAQAVDMRDASADAAIGSPGTMTVPLPSSAHRISWIAALVATACHAAPRADVRPRPATVERDASIQQAAPPASAAAEETDAAESGLSDQTLRLEWSESWNRHWGAARGADHANHVGSVSLSIFADGRCYVTDTGEMIDSVLDGEWHEQTTTSWNNRLQGKCKLDNGKLELDLVRDGAGTCSKTLVRRRGAQRFAATKDKCVLAERLSLECERRVVESARSSDDRSDDLEQVQVWDCQPGEAKAGQFVGSAFGWVFGNDRCLERIGGGRRGSGPKRYAACKP